MFLLGVRRRCRSKSFDKERIKTDILDKFVGMSGENDDLTEIDLEKCMEVVIHEYEVCLIGDSEWVALHLWCQLLHSRVVLCPHLLCSAIGVVLMAIDKYLGYFEAMGLASRGAFRRQ